MKLDTKFFHVSIFVNIPNPRKPSEETKNINLVVAFTKHIFSQNSNFWILILSKASAQDHAMTSRTKFFRVHLSRPISKKNDDCVNTT